MEASDIFVLITLSITALIMLAIGMVQFKSKKPVAFYSGEEPYKENELRDVSAWNHRHGFMWMTYGVLIVITELTALIAGSGSIIGVLSVFVGLLVPIPIMIFYHHHLIKKYKID